MGYNKDNKAYYWGVRIQNNYDKPVTFRYLLSVGGEKENATKNNYQVAWKLPNESIHTDGGDAFTADKFKSPSDDWVVKIGELCFDGMRCGGEDDCYADCDVVQKKINQPCGLKDATEQETNNEQDSYIAEKGTAPDPDGDKKDADGYDGQYTKWEQEGKDVVMTIGITETGIFWKEKEGQHPVFFKNIKPGVFRYDKGDDFMLVRFESEDRFSLWNNGSLVGYFKNPALAKKPAAPPIVKQENKPAPVTENKTVSGGCPELSGDWLAVEDNVYSGDFKSTYSHPVTIRTTSEGISWSAPSRKEYAICKKVSAISYRCDFGSENRYYGILSCNNNSVFLQIYSPNGSSGIRYKLNRK